MALPIRDGNQSPTTLSTIIVNNAHIPAHTVISFGTQGITDIATAVSGVELGPNTLNALENITVTFGQAPVTFGTAVITGSTSILNFPATQTVTFTQSSVTFGEVVVTGSTSIIGTPSVTFTQASVTFGQSSITGSVSVLNLPATQTVTFTQASVTFGEVVVTGSTSILNFPATQTVTFGTSVITGSVSVLNIPATQTVTFSAVTLAEGTAQIGSVTASISGTVPISISSVTVGNSVTIGSALPTGTNRIGVVTIGNIQRDGDGVQSSLLTEVGSGYLLNRSYLGAGLQQIGSVTAAISGTVPISISSVTVGNSVTVGSLPAISGTVTANVFGKDANNQSVDAQIPVIAYDEEITGASVSYVVPVQISNNHGTIGSSNPLPISGTVTANSSNGSLTTRFGSVTIANTAFATSAVTNSNRKYLLIQNITTASNVITVGVGFTPTTTQGIQLTAGAGLTFEGNYIPTGAVNLLSSVTASCFTILEA